MLDTGYWVQTGLREPGFAHLDPETPYSLLAFYPHFYLQDLPTTSRLHALRCKEIAEQQGLHRVHIGNLHLLGEDY